MKVKQQTAACQLCGVVVTNSLSIKVGEVSVLMCRKHSPPKLRSLIAQCTLTALRSKACKTGECKCDNMRTTCDGRPNVALLRALVKQNADTDGLLADAKRVSYATKSSIGKKRGRTPQNTKQR